MTPWFKVSVDADRNLLKIAVGGFFQLEDADRLHAEKARAHLQLRSAPHQHVTIVDVANCRIQGQDVAAKFAGMMVEERYRSRRTAYVAAGSLAKIQLRRLLAGSSAAAIFEDEESAEAWLFSPEPAVTAQHGGEAA